MKNVKKVGAVILMAVALCACSSKAEQASATNNNVEETGTAPAAVAGELYGSELTVAQTTPIADLYSDEHVGNRVRVEGTIVGVCAKRGCWIEIGDKDGNTVIFKVNDGEIVFPMKAKGSSVVAEGTWVKTVFSIEELREEGAKHALEAGEEFDPESITEAEVYWKLSGLGARVGS